MYIKRIFKGMIVIIKVEVKNCVFSQRSLTSECEIINGSWRKARMCVNSVNMRIKWTCWLTHTCTYDCVVPLFSWITHITYSWLFLSVRKLARLVATELSKWVSLLQPEIRTNVQKCPSNYIRHSCSRPVVCDRFTDISSAVSHRIYHNNLIYLWLQGERTLISWQLWYRVWPDIFVKFWFSIFYYVACTIIKRQIICRIHKEYTVRLMPCFSCSSKII